MEFERFLQEKRREELDRAYPILRDMMDSFREWFPFDESYDEHDKKDAEDAFARTKLLLEIGEYTRDDYEYLFWLDEKCTDNEEYHWAIGVFIRALSDEYGWIVI